MVDVSKLKIQSLEILRDAIGSNAEEGLILALEVNLNNCIDNLSENTQAELLALLLKRDDLGKVFVLVCAKLENLDLISNTRDSKVLELLDCILLDENVQGKVSVYKGKQVALLLAYSKSFFLSCARKGKRGIVEAALLEARDLFFIGDDNLSIRICYSIFHCASEAFFSNHLNQQEQERFIKSLVFSDKIIEVITSYIVKSLNLGNISQDNPLLRTSIKELGRVLFLIGESNLARVINFINKVSNQGRVDEIKKYIADAVVLNIDYPSYASNNYIGLLKYISKFFNKGENIIESVYMEYFSLLSLDQKLESSCYFATLERYDLSLRILYKLNREEQVRAVIFILENLEYKNFERLRIVKKIVASQSVQKVERTVPLFQDTTKTDVKKPVAIIDEADIERTNFAKNIAKIVYQNPESFDRIDWKPFRVNVLVENIGLIRTQSRGISLLLDRMLQRIEVEKYNAKQLALLLVYSNDFFLRCVKEKMISVFEKVLMTTKNEVLDPQYQDSLYKICYSIFHRASDNFSNNILTIQEQENFITDLKRIPFFKQAVVFFLCRSVCGTSQDISLFLRSKNELKRVLFWMDAIGSNSFLDDDILTSEDQDRFVSNLVGMPFIKESIILNIIQMLNDVEKYNALSLLTQEEKQRIFVLIGKFNLESVIEFIEAQCSNTSIKERATDRVFGYILSNIEQYSYDQDFLNFIIPRSINLYSSWDQIVRIYQKYKSSIDLEEKCKFVSYFVKIKKYNEFFYALNELGQEDRVGTVIFMLNDLISEDKNFKNTDFARIIASIIYENPRSFNPSNMEPKTISFFVEIINANISEIKVVCGSNVNLLYQIIDLLSNFEQFQSKNFTQSQHARELIAMVVCKNPASFDPSEMTQDGVRLLGEIISSNSRLVASSYNSDPNLLYQMMDFLSKFEKTQRNAFLNRCNYLFEDLVRDVYRNLEFFKPENMTPEHLSFFKEFTYTHIRNLDTLYTDTKSLVEKVRYFSCFPEQEETLYLNACCNSREKRAAMIAIFLSDTQDYRYVKLMLTNVSRQAFVDIAFSLRDVNLLKNFAEVLGKEGYIEIFKKLELEFYYKHRMTAHDLISKLGELCGVEKEKLSVLTGECSVVQAAPATQTSESVPVSAVVGASVAQASADEFAQAAPAAQTYQRSHAASVSADRAVASDEKKRSPSR